MVAGPHGNSYMNIDKLFDELFPIDRSILGIGYRRSLDILCRIIPFKTIDFKSGEKVFDWTIPKEWIVRRAILYDNSLKKIIEYHSGENNLSIINYSSSFKGLIHYKDLIKHLFYEERIPDAIPYVSSYYRKNWGFCISYNNFLRLNKNSTYKVEIETKLTNGFLRVGECLLKGRRRQEILISSYLCHPSLANNELSGPIALAYLYNFLKEKKLNYSYRFIINPETIGSIAYLNRNLKKLRKNIVSGMVLTCLGGRKRKLSYKLSKNGISRLDNFMIRKFKENKIKIRPFTPVGGSDERQYNSPKINLPIGQMAKTVYGEYDEYHTSFDDKSLMSINSLIKSCDQLASLILEFDSEIVYENKIGFGELQLGRIPQPIRL